jgi:hypothetical protein
MKVKNTKLEDEPIRSQHPFYILHSIFYILSHVMFLASFLSPWFRVPAGLLPSGNGSYQLIYEEPHSNLLFKLLAAMIFLIGVGIGIYKRVSNKPSEHLSLFTTNFVILLLVAIFYPAYTIQRCAKVSAHAAWLEMENLSLIISVGDAFTSQEFVYQPGQHNVELKEVLPRGFQVIATPWDISSRGLHLTRLVEILTWLGYSETYCQFVSWGWFLAVFSALTLCLSFLRTKKTSPPESVLAYPRDPAKRDAAPPPAVIAGALCFSVLICLIPPILAGHELTASENAATEGRFSDALAHMRQAELDLPVLAYHTDFLYQRGWIERSLGLKTHATQLLSAIREEEEGFYGRAEQHYFDLLNTGPLTDPARREAFRGALRSVIRDFNSGLIEHAHIQLSRLATIDPSSIKTSYSLLAATSWEARKTEMESEVAKFIALYEGFQSPEKHSLESLAHRRLADLEFDYHDIPKVSEEMRKAVTPKHSIF